MSVLRNPVQRLALTTQTGLIRLLLQCRFDFQHKIWSVPGIDSRLDRGLSSAPDSDALLPLLSAVISDFSDPAMGGAKPSKPEISRIGIRRALYRSLRKTKKTNKGKK